MRVASECYPCLESLARKTASLAKGEETGKRALQKGLDYLAANFSPGRIPAQIAGEMQRIIRQEAGCEDPFAGVKEKEMKVARQLSLENTPSSEADFRELITFAAKGNSLDFFREIETLREEIKKPLHFIHDDIGWFRSIVRNFSQRVRLPKILYLADNAGECYFDLPLVKRLEEFAEVFYVVKERPVQNDLTLKDLEQSGIREEFSRVVTTGTDTPGLDMSLASPEFINLFKSADLLIAKGMGYYETLPGLNNHVPAFLILKAKCRPVARSLGVPLNSFVSIVINNVEDST